MQVSCIPEAAMMVKPLGSISCSNSCSGARAERGKWENKVQKVSHVTCLPTVN